MKVAKAASFARSAFQDATSPSACSIAVFHASTQDTMADFNVMINLGKADLDDYTMLAKTLRKSGFSETKPAQVAADYRLLPASFRYSSETENMTSVRERALKSAKGVVATAMVLVSQV
jgi:hypothetical protein